MNRITLDSLEDPRLQPYRDLKDRELARLGGRFIAEGELVVRRLLQSDFPVESVLLARRREQELAPLVPRDVPVYVVDDAMIHRVIGFKFHSGVLACGRRKPRVALEQMLPPDSPRLSLVICPEISNTENLGAMMRIAAAFGVDAMLLGERCCDPFFRQAIRVSMGAVFSLPIVRCEDLAADLRRLRDGWGVELAATVLGGDAEPLESARRAPRFGLLFGNEAQGLGQHWIDLCHRRITIPMRRNTDSLNVAVAAGVFLYHFMRT